jgi:hypothetical protein
VLTINSKLFFSLFIFDVDPATLQMVIGLKRWVRNKQKAKSQNVSLKFKEDLTKRLAAELPRPLHFDMLNDALPLVERMKESYKAQLGEKHSYSVGCAKHFETLRTRVREKGFTLADRRTEEEETLAANAMLTKYVIFCWLMD